RSSDPARESPVESALTGLVPEPARIALERPDLPLGEARFLVEHAEAPFPAVLVRPVGAALRIEVERVLADRAEIEDQRDFPGRRVRHVELEVSAPGPDTAGR